MKVYRSSVIFMCCAIYLNSCNTSNADKNTAERKTLSLQFIDSSVKPGDNFYLFANGKWLDTAKILPTESRAGARIEMD
jgi:putative endopeptidase